MTALLENPAIRQRVARLSVADYHRLPENNRIELLRGMLIEKMPKSPLHRKLTHSAAELLREQCSAAFVIYQEGPLTSVDSEPEPDVAVVEGPKGRYDNAHPTTAVLAVEVAVSSLEIDRVKALIYAEAGVREYWIVLAEEKQVETYWEPVAGVYQKSALVSSPDVLRSTALPGVEVNLSTLFA